MLSVSFLFKGMNVCTYQGCACNNHSNKQIINTDISGLFAVTAQLCCKISEHLVGLQRTYLHLMINAFEHMKTFSFRVFTEKIYFVESW